MHLLKSENFKITISILVLGALLVKRLFDNAEWPRHLVCRQGKLLWIQTETVETFAVLLVVYICINHAAPIMDICWEQYCTNVDENKIISMEFLHCMRYSLPHEGQ